MKKGSWRLREAAINLFFCRVRGKGLATSKKRTFFEALKSIFPKNVATMIEGGGQGLSGLATKKIFLFAASLRFIIISIVRVLGLKKALKLYLFQKFQLGTKHHSPKQLNRPLQGIWWHNKWNWCTSQNYFGVKFVFDRTQISKLGR